MKRPVGTYVKYVALNAVSAVALSAALFASPASAESLTDALAAAYQSNPDLLAARAGQRATDEGVPQALSGWLPTVNAQGSYGSAEQNAKILKGGATIRTETDPLIGAVTLNQNVFAGGRTVAATNVAEYSAEAGRGSLTNVEQQILLNTVVAYMDVIKNQSVVELTKNNIDVLKRQLEATRDRFRVGELTRTDVAQSEARLSGSRTALTQAEAQLTASRSAYAKVVGHAPEMLDKPAPNADIPQSEEQARQAAAKNNPSIQAARAAERANRSAISLAKGALLPSLDLQAKYQYGREASSGVYEADESSIIGVLTVPLYQGGAEYSRVREAKELHSQSMMQIASAERGVDENVRNAWEAVRSARASIVSGEEQVSANKIALEGVRQEEEVGSQTTLDVLNAEQELLNSSVSLVTAQRNLAVAEYGLLAATGQLTAEQLKLPVKYYDAVENYDNVRYKPVGFGTMSDDLEDEAEDAAKAGGK
ncbi:MAG: TolC family outer membrane protein [Parvibaculum sp.]|nr:TolC family outer membrane protein [Parvibaculum sp.]